MKLVTFSLAAAASAAVSAYEVPDVSANDFALLETFQEEDPFSNGWVLSSHSKYAGQSWEHSSEYGSDQGGLDGDKAIIVNKAHKHYGIAKVLAEPFVPGDGGFVIQYEVRARKGISCGGAYLKLLVHNSGFKAEDLVDDSPYVLMFGPDKCGNTNKVHVIFRQENPVSKEWEEKHLTAVVSVKSDKLSHLYTLEVNEDNTFSVYIDLEKETSGSLLTETDFTPAFNPPEEIDDPEDKKPEDWVDDSKIPDPEASKPDDWDEEAPKTILDESVNKPSGWEENEPETITDPDASEPEDWDEDDDGIWEAPLIKNPKCSIGCGEWTRPSIPNPEYKGKWSAPLIDNPEYIGEWKPQKIKNPNHFYEENPVGSLNPIGAVAFEILANDVGISFDNIILAHDMFGAREFAEKTFNFKQDAEKNKERESQKKAAKEKREKALEDGGVMGAIEYYWGEAMEYATDNPIPTILSIVVPIVALIAYCCMPSKRDSDIDVATHKKDDDAAKPSDDEDEEEDEEEDDDEEEEEEQEQEQEQGKKATKRRPRKI